MDTKLYALVGRKRIVVILYYHVLDLTEKVIDIGLGIRRTHINAYHDVGSEILAHYINRKVVVDATVVNQHTVHFDRLKHYGKRHRRTYGIAERAGATHNLVLVVDIGCHAPKRHKQLVEIIAALS